MRVAFHLPQRAPSPPDADVTLSLLPPFIVGSRRRRWLGYSSWQNKRPKVEPYSKSHYQFRIAFKLLKFNLNGQTYKTSIKTQKLQRIMKKLPFLPEVWALMSSMLGMGGMSPVGAWKSFWAAAVSRASSSCDMSGERMVATGESHLGGEAGTSSSSSPKDGAWGGVAGPPGIWYSILLSTDSCSTGLSAIKVIVFSSELQTKNLLVRL